MLLFIVFFPFAAGALSYLLGLISERTRSVWVSLAGIAEFVAVALCIRAGAGQTAEWTMFCDLGVHFKMDGFRMVYSVVFALMWMMTLLFSPEYFHKHHHLGRYYLFNLITLGATAGMFLAADLYTAFIFFEIMSLTSFTWVIQEETPDAIRAANTYLVICIAGGLAALMGIFLVQHTLGTTIIDELWERAVTSSQSPAVLYVAGGCMLFGFGAKAGMFPLHIWLPKAHPVAPAPASALLSGILTKAGVFGVLAITCSIFRYDPAWGRVILVLGTITMVLGALLALLGTNFKRVLACSSLSQIGFILVGVGLMGLLGEGNALAGRGALLHMVNHSMFKLLLFMAAGVIYMNTHLLELNDIRGFGRGKPLLHFCYLMGALGIGGIPLWSGYVSKTLLHEAIVEYTAELSAAGHAVGGIHAVEWLFLFSGGLTLTYMTKLYIAVFWERNDDEKRQKKFDGMKKYMNPVSTFALVIPALLIWAMGLTPSRSMDFIADTGTDFLALGPLHHAVHYFTFENLKGAIICIVVAAILYPLVVRRLLMRDGKYVNVLPAWCDLEDSVYRPFFRFLIAVLGNLMHYVSDFLDALVLFCHRLVLRPLSVASDDAITRSVYYRAGRTVDRIAAVLNRAPLAPEAEGPRGERYVVRTAERKRRNTIVRSQMSYALALMVLTIVGTMIYLLMHNLR